MPYNSGIFSLVPSYKAVAGASIRTENHNAPLEDIANGLSSVITRDGSSSMVGPLNMGTFPIRNLAPGTATTDAATVGQGMPIGAVIDYALSNPPAGWLFCYGQSLASDTEYPLLRAALIASGSPYGLSGGNPLLPDYRGRVGAGRDDMGGPSSNQLNDTTITPNAFTLGATGGAQVHKLTLGQMPTHLHSAGNLAIGTSTIPPISVSLIVAARSGSLNGVALGIASGTSTLLASTVSGGGAHGHDISGSTGSQGSGEAHLNVQPTIITNKIIKASY